MKKQKAIHKDIVSVYLSKTYFFKGLNEPVRRQGSASNNNSSFNSQVIYVKYGTLKIFMIEYHTKNTSK